MKLLCSLTKPWLRPVPFTMRGRDRKLEGHRGKYKCVREQKDGDDDKFYNHP